ncbi:acylphosphatase [Lentisalinibacter sediminis]|uniref:acylphosphatase n=2 Tax=Lentisalinibacter sediminis TaxID=2992237 RepID=UPI00386B5092
MSDEMTDRQCLRFFVSGQVQGVWFRASTREQARRHGITGHARNLPDGRVEVLACGDPEALGRLETWLWQGPDAARVTDVAREAAPVTPPGDFSTG